MARANINASTRQNIQVTLQKLAKAARSGSARTTPDLAMRARELVKKQVCFVYLSLYQVNCN